jgi:hypothetical protein
MITKLLKFIYSYFILTFDPGSPGGPCAPGNPGVPGSPWKAIKIKIKQKN